MFMRIVQTALIAAAAALAATAPAHAESKATKARQLVERSAETVAYFTNDNAFEALWSTANNAKAMVVIPRSLRGAFMIGGSGGNAVMIARNEDGTWSEPTFFTIGSISFGFQIGGEASEVILLVMTQRGMEHLLSSTVKLGGDITIAAGPIGAGAKAQTTDVLAFSRSRGLYGGLSLEGAVLKARHSWNEAYFGAKVSPADVIYRARAHNASSTALQNAVWTLANRNEIARQNQVPVTQMQPQGATRPTHTQYEDDAIWNVPANPNN